MSNDGDASSEQNDRVTTRELSGPTRGLFSFAGMVGLVAGGIAVFESANQAGTVALLAVGSIASLLAVVGKVPLRWVIGGNEFDMSERSAQAAADEVASHLPPAATADLVERLTSIEGVRNSPMTKAMVDYVNFEQVAIGRVIQVVAKRGWTYVDASHGADYGFDGYVASQNGRQVPIEYKLVRRKDSIGRVLRDVSERRGLVASPDLIVVVSGRGTLTRQVEDIVRASDRPRLHVLFLDEPGFEDALVVAVDEALRRPFLP